MKRLLDIALSAAGLLVLSPVFGLLALLVRLQAGAPVVFRQVRVGRDFEPFILYKFRTMASGKAGPAITAADDQRVTRIGKYLRASKLDEMPQLVNVLLGQMSLVGPRPEVPQFVELYRADFEVILTVRPGITDLASLKYRDESRLLAEADEPYEHYVAQVLPDKIRLARFYAAHQSLRLDLWILTETLAHLGRDSWARAAAAVW